MTVQRRRRRRPGGGNRGQEKAAAFVPALTETNPKSASQGSRQSSRTMLTCSHYHSQASGEGLPWEALGHTLVATLTTGGQAAL